MGRPNTEQKLDMALDELVKSDEDVKDSKARQVRGKLGRGRDGPYVSRGERGDRGDRGSRLRLPPEEKGLLKTQCFFEEKDLVIKLYDTQVLVIKERTAEKTEENDDGSESKTLVLILTSGGFRTAETKAILNEALKPMALQVESGGSGWQLRSDYKAPGQVTDGSSMQPFEDGMEVTVPAVVTLKMVKENLDSRRQAAKSAADAKRAEQGQTHSSHRVPANIGGHHRAWPHWPPPPAWHVPPAHGPYRPVASYPYPPPGWPGHHAPHPYGGKGGPPPPPMQGGFKGAPGRPLSDDMFQ